MRLPLSPRPAMLTALVLLLRQAQGLRRVGPAPDGAGNESTGAEDAAFLWLNRDSADQADGAELELETPYFWPTSRGRMMQYSQSRYEGPHDLSKSLFWEWHHPKSRYHASMKGTLIDHRMNIYLAANDAIRKFAPTGELLWTYTPHANVAAIPCLYDGALFGTTDNGRVFAVTLGKGVELWVSHVSSQISENGAVQARNGVLVVASDATSPNNTNTMVRGLDTQTGTTLWEFMPDAPTWNFLALFPGEQAKPTFVFQDMEGRAYRNDLQTGELMWKNGGLASTWTDSSVMLANNLVYTVTLHGCCCGPCVVPGRAQGMTDRTHGTLAAFRLRDGSKVWSQKTHRPPDATPGIGKNLIVVPMGRKCGTMAPSDIFTFDATSGEPVWHWAAQLNDNLLCAGELDARAYQKENGLQERCKPLAWSSPTVDISGTVYLGNHNGDFYGIRDTDGDGQIGSHEVSTAHVGAAFTTAGSAHAPGMLAIVACDGLYVFTSLSKRIAVLPETPEMLVADEMAESRAKDLVNNNSFLKRNTTLTGPSSKARRRALDMARQSEERKQTRKKMLMKIGEAYLAKKAAQAKQVQFKREIDENGNDEGLPDSLRR